MSGRPDAPRAVTRAATALDRSVDGYLDYLATNRGLARNTLDAYGRDLAALLSFLGARGCAQPDAVRSDHLVDYLGWLRFLESTGALKASPAGSVRSARLPRRLPRP